MSRNDETQAILGNDSYNDDLQQSEKGQRRDVIITRIIYIIVGLIVIGVIAAVVIILITSYTSSASRKPRFTINSMFNASVTTPNTFVSAWTNTDKIFTFWTGSNSSNCELKMRNVDTNEISTLVSTSVLAQKSIACNTEYSTSYNNRFVSFKTDIVKVFRHSILGRYLVYDTAQQTWSAASPRTNERQKTMQWCPGNVNVAAYVENNNIYLKNFETQADTTVTTDGDNEVIFNGVTDWVYEEEVFGAVETFVFSPDCSKLAYLKLDDTKVKVYQYEEYGQTAPYPTTIRIRVPVPGTPNPVPSVHVYDIQNSQTQTVDIGSNTDIYIYNIQWANNTCLATTRLDRLQHDKEILLTLVTAQVSPMPSVSILVEHAEAWVQYSRETYFIPNSNGRLFVDIVPNPDSYNVIMIDTLTQQKSVLVSGAFDVLHIYPVFNPSSNEIFIASAEQGSTSRHIYAVSITTGARRCLSNTTASSASSANQGAGFTDMSFSATGQFGILFVRGPAVPSIHLLKLVPSVESVAVLEDNANLAKARAEYDLPSVELTTIKSADKKYDLNMMITKPPAFSEGIQYPVLMYVYGGPGSQLVSSAFQAMYRSFNTYVASLGFLVVTVDGRGTGAKGYNFLTCTYKRLAELETEDQIATAKYLKTLNYVNPNSIAIFGWSYGGTMTISSIMSSLNSNVFALGLAVAPVTDWRFYDTAYTERYMQLPTADSNLAGYQNSSMLNRVSAEADNLNCNKNLNIGNVKPKTAFLLVHGTGDDNVRPLNSFNLMTRMQTCGVQFDVMFYPNKDHGIPGVDTQKHLYRMMSNKLQSTLLGSITDL